MSERRPTDVAFTEAVKAAQTRKGSRAAMQRLEEHGWRTEVDGELAAFLAEIDTAFMVTASAAGQPYAQHRGGPKGFIHVLGPRTLGFADFIGNRQYITTGNLAENSRAFLFLMDYANRRRVKIWGRARVVADDPALIARLMPPGYRARADQAIVFDIESWSSNCPQHIPRKLDADAVAAVIERLQRRIRELEATLCSVAAESQVNSRVS
jgi:uncharacterized protein